VQQQGAVHKRAPQWTRFGRSLRSFGLELFWRIGDEIGPGSVNSWLEAENAAGSDVQRRIGQLRQLLRRYPYWSRGHLRFSELSLQVDDVASAYASGRAALALVAAEGKEAGAAYFILGRCHLRRDDWAGSIPHLERAEQLLGNDRRVVEELAAAHMAGGDYTRAREYLERIPNPQLTPPARAALEFIRSR
jgi:hypothetical protein